MQEQFQTAAEVLRTEQLTRDIYRLTLLAPLIARVARPGQFVMLRISENGYDPLLRRPFSIYQATAGTTLQILFKVVGKGTRAMTGLQAGDSVSLVGPLGRGFSIEPQRAWYLVGGGMGAAPLFFLTTWLLRHPAARDPVILLGARNKGELRAIAADFEATGLEVTLATDDGSEGHHGYVVDLLPNRLAGEKEPLQIYSCGPYPMLRGVANLCHLHGWPCQVSLETMMACGLAACLGCALPQAGLSGYLHVCKDGPVLDAAALAWF